MTTKSPSSRLGRESTMTAAELLRANLLPTPRGAGQWGPPTLTLREPAALALIALCEARAASALSDGSDGTWAAEDFAWAALEAALKETR